MCLQEEHPRFFSPSLRKDISQEFKQPRIYFRQNIPEMAGSALNQGAWIDKYGGKTSAEADGAMSGVKAFNEGLKSALASAVEEQGLLEMMTDVVDSWVQNFKADMKGFAPQLKLGATAELRALSSKESKPDAFKERLASWQDLLREKSQVLHQAVHDWAHRRDRRSSFSFRGFLGESVLNPVADAYELLAAQLLFQGSDILVIDHDPLVVQHIAAL